MPKQPTNAGQRLRCVVADDVRAIREQVSVWLEEMGFRVVLASCGATALEAIRLEIPNLVVSDIDMPHSSGLQMTRTLRNDPDSDIAAVPVIIISSLEDRGVNRAVKGLSGCTFLKKPLEKVRFTDCVRRIVAGEKPVDDVAGLPHQISRRFRQINTDIGS